jgi:hypothetical protein
MRLPRLASSASIRGVAPVLVRIFSFVRSRRGCRRRTAVLVAADLSAVPRTASPHFADRSEILDHAFNSNRDALIWLRRNGYPLVFVMAAVCPIRSPAAQAARIWSGQRGTQALHRGGQWSKGALNVEPRFSHF